MYQFSKSIDSAFCIPGRLWSNRRSFVDLPASLLQGNGEFPSQLRTLLYSIDVSVSLSFSLPAYVSGIVALLNLQTILLHGTICLEDFLKWLKRPVGCPYHYLVNVEAEVLSLTFWKILENFSPETHGRLVSTKLTDVYFYAKSTLRRSEMNWRIPQKLL